MIEPRLTENEEGRLEALCALNILDSPEEERFDRITRLAAAMFDVPMALVSLVDRNRQWFKSQHGLGVSQTPRSISFCGHAIHHAEALIVPDATLDQRFLHNPLVTGAPYIRFYAGYPVFSPHGHPLGTLCIIDTRARRADEINIRCLRDLAQLAEDEIGKAVVMQRSFDRNDDPDAASRQLAQHVHHSPLAVVQWDSSLRVTAWSNRAEEMFGWRADEVVGKHPDAFQFIHEADRERTRDKLLELIDHHVPHLTSQSRIRCKDGSIVHGRWHSSALFGPDGALVSVVSLVDDISAQVKIEAELRESEAILRATFEQAAVGMAHIGLDGGWLRVNQKLCEIVGYSEKELRTLTFQSITHPDDLATDFALGEELLNGRKDTYIVEKRYLRKGGAPTWVHLTVSLKRRTSGEPEYFISVVKDINARKAVELALQHVHEELESRVEQRTLDLKRSNDILAFEIDQRRKAESVLLTSEERIRTVIKSSHDAFIGIDSNGIITDWNDAAETTFGWTTHETVGRNVADIIIPPQYRDVHGRGLRRFLESPSGTVLNDRIEMPALRRSGEEFPVEMAVSLYKIGGAAYISAFLHDISARKRAVKELSEKQNLLDAILETIDVAVVACDDNGELTLFNRAAREFHGFGAERLLPDEWSSHYDLFDADGKTPMQTEDIPLFRALQGKIVKDAEMVIAAKHTSPRYLLASGRPMIGPQGEKLGAVVAMNDITERKESDRLLMLSEKRLRAIAENLPAMIAHVDNDEKFIFVNHRAAKYFGKGIDQLIGESVSAAYGEREYRAIKPHIDRALSGVRTSFESDFVVRDKSFHFQLIYDPCIDHAGVVTGFYAVAFDITDRKKSELRQAESEERLRTITDSLPVLISYIDKEERYRFANATFTNWFGLTPAEMIGNTVEQMLGSEIYRPRSEYLQRALAGESIRFEMDLRLNGEAITVDTQYLPHWKEGVIEGVYNLASDVTAAKSVEKQLYLLARIDALTELPNRRGFDEYLKDAAMRCNRTGKTIALMLLDIDQFKQINDTFGHAAGDYVLKEFAHRLRNLVRSTDRVSRLAGDEFTVILEDAGTQETAMVIAVKILERIREPFMIDGNALAVTASIGISFLQTGDSDVNHLTVSADEALYAAKGAGRNQYQIK